jgi:hypothetical protein
LQFDTPSDLNIIVKEEKMPNGLINVDLELDLISCLMRDSSLGAQLVTLYRGVAEDTTRLFGDELNAKTADFILSRRQRVPPALLKANIPEFPAQETWDRWRVDINAQWKETAKKLRELAMQREAAKAIRQNNWAVPLESVPTAISDLERRLHEIRSAILPYDSSPEARVNAFLEARGKGQLGRLVMTGIPEWDNILMGGFRIDPGEMTVLHGAPKAFKAQPVWSMVRTVNGYKRMGDLRVGDRLASIDGRESVVEGIFPQGRRPIFKITFYDGRFTHCTEDHLWNVFYRDRKEKWETVTTGKIIADLKNLSRDAAKRLAIPLASGEWGEEKDLPIDPYVLGVLLGDGGLSSGSILITTTNQDILRNVSSKIPDYELRDQSKKNPTISYRLVRKKRNNSNYYRDALSNLGLWGKRSYEKFIPQVYLDSSRSQRMELLRGLMDTDGTAPHRSCDYRTTSERLALGVQELVRSIGGIATISKRQASYKKGGKQIDCRDYFIVSIRVNDKKEIYGSAQKSKSARPRTKKPLRLCIKSIEAAGWAECQCIKVSHPSGLYITDSDIVTHNTTLAINLIVALARQGIGTTHICAEKGYSINDVVIAYLKLLTAEKYMTMFNERVPSPNINHDNLKWGKLDGKIGEAFNVAAEEFKHLPIYLYARPYEEGGTADIGTALGWARLDREGERRVSVVLFDNFSSYRNESESDYDLLLRLSPQITSLQSEYGLYVLAISQENTLGNVRGSPVDLIGLINNELAVKRNESQDSEHITSISVKVAAARFQATGNVATIKIHKPSGLILR